MDLQRRPPTKYIVGTIVLVLAAIALTIYIQKTRKPPQTHLDWKSREYDASVLYYGFVTNNHLVTEMAQVEPLNVTGVVGSLAASPTGGITITLSERGSPIGEAEMLQSYWTEASKLVPGQKIRLHCVSLSWADPVMAFHRCSLI